MKLEHSVVAIFDTHAKAEAAQRRVQQAGVDVKRLSIIGKDFLTDEHPVGSAVGALATTLENAGLPPASAKKYDGELRTGKFLVMALGPEAMLNRTRSVLSESGALHVETHAVTNPGRAALVTRQSVLAFLNDNEVSKVSNAESARHLGDGDEYLDLEHLSLGVQRAHRVPEELGRVLPRKAVSEGTWLAVLEHLNRPEVGPTMNP